MEDIKTDEGTTLQDLKNIVRNFCEERGWDEPHNPKDLAVGMVTEACELLEMFRFRSEKDSLSLLEESKGRESIGEELADTLCFILRFAQKYQFDLTQCLQDKLQKNAKKYPPPIEPTPTNIL